MACHSSLVEAAIVAQLQVGGQLLIDDSHFDRGESPASLRALRCDGCDFRCPDDGWDGQACSCVVCDDDIPRPAAVLCGSYHCYPDEYSVEP